MFKKDFDKGCMLVVGGAKSGKSSFALRICNALNKKRIFLATAQAKDNEMEKRIRHHQQERGSGWQTQEEPLRIIKAIQDQAGQDSVVLIDCITLWVNNLYMEYGDDRRSIEIEMERLVDQLSETNGTVVLVSNDVGSGIVPDNPLARIYRDDMGILNQRIARIARKVVTLIAGLPMVLKDE